MDSGQTRNSSGPRSEFLHCHLKEHEFRGNASPSKTSTNSEPLLDAPGCKAIKDNKRAQAHSDRCRVRLPEGLRITPQGTERLDRRSEVIDEALAEETQRGEQRKKKCDKTTAAILEPEPAALEAHDLRESPIEPNPNPKRRLLMRSASSTASGSGQQSAERPARDTESGVRTGDPLEMGTGESTTLPGASSANTRRRTVRTSSSHHARCSRRVS